MSAREKIPHEWDWDPHLREAELLFDRPGPGLSRTLSCLAGPGTAGRGSPGPFPARLGPGLSRTLSRRLFPNSAERGAAHPRAARWCSPAPPRAGAVVRAALAPPRARSRHCGLFVRARSERGREAVLRLCHVHSGAPPPDARLQEVSGVRTHGCPAPLWRARGWHQAPRGQGRAPRGAVVLRGSGSRRAAPALFEPPRLGADG